MKKPFPPPSLSSPFGSEHLRSTVASLLESPEAMAQLHEAERDHPYWEKFMRRVSGIGLPAEHLWHWVKLQRSMATRPLDLGTGMRFAYMLTNGMQQTLHKLDLHMGGSIGSATTIPDGMRDQLLVSSLMEEAISSSLLEGAATTRELAREMLRTEKAPRNQAERMVLNNYRTMRMLVDWKAQPMTVDRLLEIHRTVTEGTLEKSDDEGKLRGNDDVHVVDAYGEVLYTPPPHPGVRAMLEGLCAFANDSKEEPFIHPVVRGTILHFLIGYIHPFVDGNGRTARALFYWYLLRNGYWMVEYMAISKVILRAPAQYARAYLHTEQDGNDLTYFLDYNLRALRVAMEEMDGYLKHKLAERQQLFSAVRHINLNERQADLVALWLREPERVLTFHEVAIRFNVVYQTARTDLLGLVEDGLATQRRSGKKIMFFRSSDLEARLHGADRT